jgi:hypothetical protein
VIPDSDDAVLLAGATLGCSADALAFVLSAEAWPVFLAWRLARRASSLSPGEERAVYELAGLAAFEQARTLGDTAGARGLL